MRDEGSRRRPVTRRERAVRAYAKMHRAYLRHAHPDAWKAMLANGTLRAHCRRRAVNVYDMRERLIIEMLEAVQSRTYASEMERIAAFEGIPSIAHELAEAEIITL